MIPDTCLWIGSLRAELTFVLLAQSDHENPELVWNAEFRSFVQDHVTSFLNEYYASPSLSETETSEDTVASSITDKFVVDYFSVSPYPITGNVHLPLFLKNPTIQLREPLYVLTFHGGRHQSALLDILLVLGQTLTIDSSICAQILCDVSLGRLRDPGPRARAHYVVAPSDHEPGRRRDSSAWLRAPRPRNDVSRLCDPGKSTLVRS